MIERLQMLKASEDHHDHFHFRTNDFDAENGIADIQFSKAQDSEKSNMEIE